MKHTLAIFSAAPLLLALALPGFAATEPMTLDAFLSEVRQSHEGFKGAVDTSLGAKDQASDASLAFQPTLFATVNQGNDASYPLISFIPYDSQENGLYSIGLSQQTRFGLQAKFTLAANYLNYVNLQPSPYPVLTNVFTVPPKLELTLPLLSNGFGRLARASEHLSQAQSLATSYGSSFAAKQILLDAESSYWRLAIARQTLEVQQTALDRAAQIYEWNKRRARLQLADIGDALASEANLNARKLDLQSARDEVRAASLAFNSARNTASDQVTETLTPVTPELIGKLVIPKRVGDRDDVKAAMEQQEVAISSAQINKEKDLPQLNLVGSVYVNGQNTSPVVAAASAFNGNRPSYSVGLSLNMPLNFSSLAEARAGLVRQQEGAELTLQRKQFEQKQSWTDLNAKLIEARRRMSLAQTLVGTQDAKLKREKEKLRAGRSTTYQVLLYDTDYLVSQLQLLRIQSEILNVVAQMKLFGDTL